MSLFYRFAYRIGFTPWEEGLAQASVRRQIDAMFDREEAERDPPLGKALDLGCGTGIHAVDLARRGWRVTGIDLAPTALERARERAREAGVEIDLVEGDVTALRDAGVGKGFDLIVDFGTVHGLGRDQVERVGRGVDAVAAADATLLMLAFAPGKRGPVPRGMGRDEIERTYPAWDVVDEEPQDAELPWFLAKLGADPRWYRLRRR